MSCEFVYGAIHRQGLLNISMHSTFWEALFPFLNPKTAIPIKVNVLRALGCPSHLPELHPKSRDSGEILNSLNASVNIHHRELPFLELQENHHLQHIE